VGLLGGLALGLLATGEPSILRDPASLAGFCFGILSFVVLAALLARGMWLASVFAVLVIVMAGPIALIVSTPHMSSWAGLVLVYFVGVAIGTLVLAAPALILCTVYGRRYDLGAGDDVVGALGVYALVVLPLELWALGWPTPHGALRVGVYVAAAVLSVGAVAVSLVRRRARRRFCLRALKGEAAGFRVRAPLTTSEVSSIPAIFASAGPPPDTVLVRVELPAPGEQQTSRAVAAFASFGLAG
jgi:hypothetical protein